MGTMFASIGAGLLGSPAAPPPVQEKRCVQVGAERSWQGAALTVIEH